MRNLILGFLLSMHASAFCQDVKQRLGAALELLKKDEQFSHAAISMYVVDSKTGSVVFDKDAQLGLQPASTQKVITSVSAFELLGQQYRFKTMLVYDGQLQDGALNGNLIFTGGGDPTAGSPRWARTNAANYLQQVSGLIKAKGIRQVNGEIISDTRNWETQATPRGWIWEDIGNYYGAGVWGLNWNENQYDLNLAPGKNVGDKVSIVGTSPMMGRIQWINELRTGKEGSGDNSIIYLGENSNIAVARGTVPAGKATFTVKGAVANGATFFLSAAAEYFAKIGLGKFSKEPSATGAAKRSAAVTELGTISSPPLDSINFWFLKKSINLYGEAIVKAIAFEKKGFGATDSGLAIVRHFWSQRGIEKSALKIIDGSGLSPANRVTTHALATVMLYARKQPWFSSFYTALPEMNDIRMKDGYISGVRSYTGYIKSAKGVEYTFAFIVNNFDGSPSNAREKMWSVLNILK